jgi:hypothetical protein
LIDLIRVPQRHQPLARLCLFSFIEVASREFAWPHIHTSAFGFLLKTGAVAGVFHATSRVLERLQALFPFIPCSIWLLVASFLLSETVNRIAHLGIMDTVDWYFNTFVGFLLGSRRGLQQLPEDHVVPEDLRCPICHELLSYPQEIFGFQICLDCLTRWMQPGPNTHPVTGEQITSGMITPCVLMRIVSDRYRQMVLANGP